MSWLRRHFGASKPAPAPSVLRMNAIREAVISDGGQTGGLALVLKQSADLNTHPGDPVFPLLLIGKGIMMTKPGTFALIPAAMLYKAARALLLVKHGSRLDVTCAISSALDQDPPPQLRHRAIASLRAFSAQ